MVQWPFDPVESLRALMGSRRHLRGLTAASVPLVLLGCGYDELTYEDDLLDAYCEKFVDCMWLFEDVRACREDGPPGVAGVGCDACDYDGGAAHDCLVAFEDMSCEEFIRWRLGEIGSPVVCSEVFTGCDVAEECQGSDTGS